MNIGPAPKAVKIGRTIGALAGSATLILRRIGADQKVICGFPGRTCRRQPGWRPALGVVGGTAALIALDPVTAPLIQRPSFQSSLPVRAFNEALNAQNMAGVINGTPLVAFFAGAIRKDTYLWQTALLAGEAAASAEILAVTMKHLDRRVRPLDITDGDFSRTWFRTKRRDLGGAGCFPSGHTASAFAIATIFADRYPQYRRLALGCAVLIGCSRLSTRAHYPSDVFFGAALGFSISHFVVAPRAGQMPLTLLDATLMQATEHIKQQYDQKDGSEANARTATGAPSAIAVVPASTAQ